MGANQGRAKGNKQSAEYKNLEGRHEKSGRRERGKPRKRKRNRAPGKQSCFGRTGKRRKGKNRKLSSLKLKVSGRKKANGKRIIPKVKTEGKHLWNGCGSETGKSERKRTVKPSTGTWKEGMRNQAGEKGETEKARAESGTGKAAVRQNREEKERKNRG